LTRAKHYRTAWPLALALGLALALLGCQAERIEVVACASSADCSPPQTCRELACVDDGALRIDDFEDSDPFPLDHDFSVWRAYTYNAGAQYVDFSVGGPGHDSDQAIHLDFEIHDPPNGNLDFGLAGLDSAARNLTADLSAYSTVSFSYRFEPSNPECQGAARMAFGFYCAEQVANFETDVFLSADWQTAQVALASFHEVMWRPATGVPFTECLAKDSALYFEVVPDVNDGECAAGRVSMDTIYFR
jgi:hypothetical protein